MSKIGFIYNNQKLRNIKDLGVPLTIEMPIGMWNEEFRNWKAEEFCSQGKIFENPHIIKSLTEKQKQYIDNAYYRVYPIDVRTYVEKYSLIRGYHYVGEISNGMYIEHTKE